MYKYVNLKWAIALAVPVIAALTLAMAASASQPVQLTFSASKDGASAGWSHGKGSPIDLTLGTSAGSFAEIVLHHLGGFPVNMIPEPQFTTSNYASGSPRYYITLSNGDTLWGYPPQAGVSSGSTFAWAVNNGNTYESWGDVQQTEGTETVTGAFVIADADQAAGTVDQITGLSFGGAHFN